MSMLPATLDISRTRADTFPFDITIKLNGTAIDITGATFILTVDPSPDPTSNANNLFANVPVIQGAGSAGTIRVTLSPTDADQTPGEYFHDIQMTDSGGFVRTVASGQWNVVQDVTK